MNNRKESICALANDGLTNTETRISDDSTVTTFPINSSASLFPFAIVLRLRVLQIVCAISGVVMGAVAVIEEKGNMNIGMAIPAGCVTILAAGASIHTSRGFGGYRPQSPTHTAPRFLRPMVVPLAILWSVACSLYLALIVHIIKTFLSKPSYNISILAVVELILTITVLTSVCAVFFINCRYGPD